MLCQSVSAALGGTLYVWLWCRILSRNLFKVNISLSSPVPGLSHHSHYFLPPTDLTLPLRPDLNVTLWRVFFLKINSPVMSHLMFFFECHLKLFFLFLSSDLCWSLKARCKWEHYLWYEAPDDKQNKLHRSHSHNKQDLGQPQVLRSVMSIYQNFSLK